MAFPYTMLRLSSIPSAADQAGAGAIGLTPGCLFRDGSGALFVKT